MATHRMSKSAEYLAYEKALPKPALGADTDPMASREIKHAVLECTCGRCGKVWIAKIHRSDAGKLANLFPVACPRCKNLYWNRPRVRAKRKPK